MLYEVITPLAGPTVPGEVFIDEIMRDSVVTAPDKGEWVELRSVAADALDLRGCSLSDGAGRAVTVGGPVPVTIAAGGYFV